VRKKKVQKKLRKKIKNVPPPVEYIRKGPNLLILIVLEKRLLT